MNPSIAALLLLFPFLLLGACSKPADVAAKSTTVGDAREFQATQDIVQLRRNCVQYQAVKGELPADLEALGTAKNDPWGNPYLLDTESGILDVYSAGPDGQYETQDDIRAPE